LFVPPELQHYIDTGAVVKDDGVLRLSDPVDITFNLSNKNHDLDEFLRQGDLPERSLNQQSVADWQGRIDAWELNGRDKGPSQDNYRAEQIQLRADALNAVLAWPTAASERGSCASPPE
jgi:hypothetical protein